MIFLLIILLSAICGGALGYYRAGKRSHHRFDKWHAAFVFGLIFILLTAFILVFLSR